MTSVMYLSPAGTLHLLAEVTSAKAFSTVMPLTLSSLAAQSKAPLPSPSEETTSWRPPTGILDILVKAEESRPPVGTFKCVCCILGER